MRALLPAGLASATSATSAGCAAIPAAPPPPSPPSVLAVTAREVALLLLLRQMLVEPAIQARFRLHAHDWTRRRLLTFEVVVAMILQGHKQAFASILQRAFGWLGRLRSLPQPASFCEARHKLDPGIFLALTQATTQDFYTRPRRDLALLPHDNGANGANGNADPDEDSADSEVSLVWHGHRVLAVDGTKWNLPNTPGNRERFGAATNQHDAVGCAQAQGLVLHDVLNDLGLHAVPAPTLEGKVPAEKAILFEDFLPFTEPEDVMLLDRGFGAYSVMAFWEGTGEKTPAEKTPAEKTPAEKTPAEKTPAEKTPAEKTPAEKTPAEKTPAEKTPAEKTPAEKTPAEKTRRYYVIRMTRHSFKAVREFWKRSAGQAQAQTWVKIAVTPDQRQFVQEHGLPEELEVRLIKITLPNGEEEVLATNLLDARRYPVAEIADLYRQRWAIEGYIDRLKNIFEIERLGVQRPDHLLQDFYGVVFLSTLESVLTRREQHLLERRTQQRGCQHQKQVNRAQSYLTMIDRTLELLLDNSKPIPQTLEELHLLFQWNPTLKRENRSFPRDKPSYNRQLRHHKYFKRSLT